MKKFLVGAVATAALLTPAVAAADTNAVFGVHYGTADVDDIDVDAYGFNGGFSHDLDSATFFQFDGDYSRLDIEGDCCFASSYGAAHYGMRNDQYALAGFVSLNDFFAYSGFGYGIEGAFYMPNVVINGSLAGMDFDDLDLSGYNAAIDGSFFVTPNFAINGLISYTEADDALDADWTTYGLSGEYRFHGPMSVELGWRNTDFDGGDVDAWTIGLNFDLGTGSLRDRASSGPSMVGGANLHEALGALLP